MDPVPVFWSGNLDGVTEKNYEMMAPIRPRAASIAPGEAYSSDIFQLQVQELLEDIRPKYDRTLARVESVLRKLKHTIESIPPRDALPVCWRPRRSRKLHRWMELSDSPRFPTLSSYYGARAEQQSHFQSRGRQRMLSIPLPMQYRQISMSPAALFSGLPLNPMLRTWLI